MANYRIETDGARCQSYGNCVNVAPTAFGLDRARKVRVTDPGQASDASLLKAAKLCPYRAITVIDPASGEAVFPRWIKRP